jgi:hypothetical protein
MTPVKKTTAIQDDPATLAFWHAAETGELAALESLLPRVDVNACNEHGVTALMRAAQNGHVRIARALLQNGADANIKRNDKFTALALAAFFGHTEVVRALMEYGADSRAATRNGTSPQMWASARTFNAVAKSLQKRASAQPDPVPIRTPAPAPVRLPKPKIELQPAPAAETSAPRAVSTEIRTLKDPPEIWDLVHEVPRGFNARSAFMTRLQSVRSGWTFRVAAGMIVVAMGVVGMLVLRGVQARSERNSAQQAQASPQTITNLGNSQAVSNNGWQAVTDNSSQPATNNTVPPVTAAAPPAVADNATAPSTTISTDASASVRKPGSRPWFMSSRRVRGAARESVAEEAVQPSVPVVEKSEAAPRSTAVTNKPATPAPLSPQLISPPKSATPKGKVIQWP